LPVPAVEGRLMGPGVPGVATFIDLFSNLVVELE